jgi:hypothetical protein
MVEANVKIISELKYFLTEVVKNPEIRMLFTESECDFSRKRKLPFEKIVGIIINLPKRSLSIEIQEFFEELDCNNDSCTKGAFSLQRTKLQAMFFEEWNQFLVSCFYHYYGDKVQRWRGFRLLAVDGSTAYLLNKREVVDYFGTQDNQYTSKPIARVMQIQDILNNITVWGTIRSIKESEQAIIIKQTHQLYSDSITLFDRAYPGFPLMYLMNHQSESRHFVIRCKKGYNNVVKQFVKSRKNDKIVELYPSRDHISILREHNLNVTEETTLKIRMVKVKLKKGEVEILLTNLYNEQLYTIEDLKYLYGLRWGIETTYGHQKNQQQMEQFSGHRVICIQQDNAAGLFVPNLQSLIEKQCENYLDKINRRRKHRYKINKNISWGSLKHNVIKLFLHNNAEDILNQIQEKFERNLEPIRPGRKYPRIVKAKRLYGRYQTFTNYKRAI